MRYDFAVIGGGIVGLATARELLRRRPGKSLVLLEKEDQVARHQTGHTSGVIHAGVYYAPGSLKARLCKLGEAMVKDYCAERGVAFRVPGKLIVATDETERVRLDTLAANALANGLRVFDLDAAGLRAHEQNIAGVAALRVPRTGIADDTGVCRALAEDVAAAGEKIRLGQGVNVICKTAGDVRVETESGPIGADHLVVCAGFQADRMVEIAGEAWTAGSVATPWHCPRHGDHFSVSARIAPAGPARERAGRRVPGWVSRPGSGSAVRARRGSVWLS